jgi:chemotaxis protein CheD
MAARIDIHLQPGQHVVGDARHRVHTLLGSCVSITLWHPRRRIGAMSHFLLAERQGGAARAADLDARYGREAMALMVRDLRARGVEPAACRAKVFGGADMFPERRHSLRVGRRNGAAALALLAEHGIALAADSLFGTAHRRIVFDIASGDVWASRSDDSATMPLDDEVMP